MKLSACKRVVLMDYDSATGMVEFRHYYIETAVAGVSRSVKRVIETRVPSLSKYEDISQYILGDGAGSDSENESDPDAKVDVTRTTMKKKVETQTEEKRSVRLHELGPRMTLSLVKIQDGLDEGDILYHSFVTKDPEEAERVKLEHKRRAEEKARRIKEQEKNVERKKKAKQRDNSDDEKAASEDDDAEWYRREVGEEPDADFVRSVQKRKEGSGKPDNAPKKEKYNPLFRKRKKKEDSSSGDKGKGKGKGSGAGKSGASRSASKSRGSEGKGRKSSASPAARPQKKFKK